MYFNSEHYEKVYKARREASLNVSHKKQIENSNYVGKYLTSNYSGKTYLVEADWEEYCSYGFGWYKRMLLCCNGSHRTIIYENINNDDESFKKNISKTKKEFDL